MKISKRVREDAALICAIAASNDTERGERPSYDREVAQWIGLWRGDMTKTHRHSAAVRLALAAWIAIWNALPMGNWTPEIDAEAESLLRCGWSPGDEL